MSIPTTRKTFREYCLRAAGDGVIDINVSDKQIEDRIDDAILYWQNYHYDGIQRLFVNFKITASTITLAAPSTGTFQAGERITAATSGAVGTILKVNSSTSLDVVLVRGSAKFSTSPEGIIGSLSGATGTIQTVNYGNFDNQYLSLPPNILAVRNVVQVGTAGQGDPLLDLGYQLAVASFSDVGHIDMTSFVSVKQNLEMITNVLVGRETFDYNRKQDRLYIRADWLSTFKIGNYIGIECFATIDPETWSKVWQDTWLRKYATALIKAQWGQNLSKYTGVQIAGGVTFNGDKILTDAKLDIEKLEKEMDDKFSEPIPFRVA